MPVISITFYMVIFRITLSKSTSQAIAYPPLSGSGRLTLSRVSRPNRERDHRMRRVEVRITRLTETNELEESRSGSREPNKDGKTEGGIEPAVKVHTSRDRDSFASV